MRTCEQIEVWISAYQDGELDPRRRHRVEEHLAECAACRELLAEWTALERILQTGLTRCEAPETLHTRVMREILDKQPSAAPVGRRGSWLVGGWFSFGLASLGAAAALVLAATRSVPLPPEPTKTEPLGTTATVRLPEGGGEAVPVAISIVAKPKESKGSLGGVRDVTPRKPAEPAETKPAPKETGQPGGKPRKTRPRIDALRELRQLRRGRPVYRVAESSRRRRHRNLARGPQRRPETRMVKAGPPPASVEPRQPDVQSTPTMPRVRVVDYVLPQVLPEVAASESETQFVLRPAGLSQVAQVGYEF